MNAKRKAAQDIILKYVDKAAAGGDNLRLYTEFFKSLDDAEFDKYMRKLRDKKSILSVVVPQDGSVKVSVSNNIKLAKSLGYDFYQRLRFTDPDTGDNYLTPNKYLVYRLPVRRTSQLQSKGLGVPKHTNSIDMLSGQVANASKADTLTMPELQMLTGMGLVRTGKELAKYRGGDLGAKSALVNILYAQGRVDAKTLDEYSTGVVAAKTLRTYMNAAHIRTQGLGE